MTQDLSKMTKLSRTKITEFLGHLGGSMFGVTFTKKDGSTRNMVCRLHVTKGVKGTRKGGHVGDIDQPYLTVFDMNKAEFRSVNLDTISEIRTHGRKISVK